MIALVRYTASIMFHSQRYLPSALVFVACMGVFANGAGDQPVVPIFAPMTGAALVCSAWLAVTLINLEDPVQRSISAVNSGRSLLVAVVVVVLLASMALAALVVALPAVLGNDRVTTLDLLTGAVALVAASCLGTAIGLITSRLVVRRPGHSLLSTLLLLVVVLLTRGLPPINPLILRLARTESAGGEVLADTALDAGVAVVVLVLCAVLTRAVSARRE
ncbi:hypothetical protein [Actinokineospora pegani]|uniref:hypothetical protein n=1 Tax=Actinokineospora pegani TaxID=2654637 RepID=UPI0012E9ED0A|nr:hypothetical protein [Actinokineospora pegani]